MNRRLAEALTIATYGVSQSDADESSGKGFPRTALRPAFGDVEHACQRTMPIALVLAVVWFANAHRNPAFDTSDSGPGLSMVCSAMASIVAFGLVGVRPVRVASPVITIAAAAWTVMLGVFLLATLEVIRSGVATGASAMLEPAKIAVSSLQIARVDVERIFPSLTWLPLVSAATAWCVALCDPD